MRFHILVLVMTIMMSAVSPAAAETCADLWLARNAVFDDAEYCFGSALGKSVFDNSDCTTKSPELSAREKTRIAMIKQLERDNECAVDTNKTVLDVDLLSLRLKLKDQPITDGLESSCIGYITTAPVPLYAGQSESSPILGYVEDGDQVNLNHLSEQGWEFASGVWRGDTQYKLLGWHRGPIEKCRAFAG